MIITKDAKLINIKPYFEPKEIPGQFIYNKIYLEAEYLVLKDKYQYTRLIDSDDLLLPEYELIQVDTCTVIKKIDIKELEYYFDNNTTAYFISINDELKGFEHESEMLIVFEQLLNWWLCK